MKLGQQIKQLRLARHLSVKDLAHTAGIAPSTLYDIERGDQAGTTKLHRLADALGVSPADLEHGAVSRIADAPQTYSLSAGAGRLVRRIESIDRSGALTPALVSLLEHVLAYAAQGSNR